MDIYKLIARAKTVATAAVSWIIVLQSVILILADEIGKAFPNAAEGTAAVAARVLAILVGIVSVLRRVSPVLPEERGLLPKDDPALPGE